MQTAIHQKSVRTLAALEPILVKGAKFRFAFPVSEIGDVAKENLGLPTNGAEGFSFLPGVCGPKSDANANGRIIIRKDLPMEKLARGVLRTWKDWHGHSHFGLQNRTYSRYPRELDPPQEELFYIMPIDGEMCVCSALLTFDDKSDDRIIWCLNLFLECFGECFVADENNQGIKKPRFKRLNWELLPQGDYPWERLAKMIHQRLEKTTDSKDIDVALWRMKFLRELGSTNVGFGRAGFNGYVAFEFRQVGLWVLEATQLDNATYVFEHDWESLSCMSKQEVLSGNLCKCRVIHDRRWKHILRSLVSPQRGLWR